MKTTYLFSHSKLSENGNTVIVCTTEENTVSINGKTYETALGPDNFVFGVLKGKVEVNLEPGDKIEAGEPNDGRIF